MPTTTAAALFRGINVGGRNRLPMKALAEILAGLGLSDVRTYIQSGNAAFRCERKALKGLGGRIAAAVAAEHGFAPEVQVLQAAALRRALAANPFPAAEDAPKTLHLWFLAQAPRRPDLDALATLAAADERFALKGRVFYLHAPSGIGRSRLAARVEKSLGVSCTARNWRTALQVTALLDAL